MIILFHDLDIAIKEGEGWVNLLGDVFMFEEESMLHEMC